MQGIYKIIKIFYWVLLIFFSLLIVYNSIPYYWFNSLNMQDYAKKGDYFFLLEKGDLLNQLLWKTCFYLHITGAMISIITGIPQFFTTEKKYRKAHILIGKIYVVAVLCVACPSGFYMSFYTKGGIWGIIPFMSIAVLWFITTYIGYRYVLHKNIQQHRLWMVRSYAVTLSAVTFRIYQVILHFSCSLDPTDNYIYSLWLSFLGNFILGEIAVYYYRNVALKA